MTEKALARARVRNLVLLLSAVAWVGLLIGSGDGGLAHCPVTRSGVSPDSLEMLLKMNPPAVLILSWFVMLVAMMLPTLIEPLRHVLERNFRRRHFRSVLMFLTGYAAIWMVVGSGMLAAQLLLRVSVSESYLPALVISLIALIWQCSPLKQCCLNRGHNHRELRAFGIEADWDALLFGLNHGCWCVGSCWALMMFSMLLPNGHFISMLVVTVLMISERLDRPRPLGWRLRGPGKLVRIIAAQIRPRLNIGGGRLSVRQLPAA